MTGSSRLLLAVVIAVASGCAGNPRPNTPGDRRIGSVQVVGAAAVDDDEITDGLGLVHARETGQPFARFLVAQDTLRIQGFYLRRGYLAVTVTPDAVRRGERTDVTFTITEGPRARLARVEIDGLEDAVGVTKEEMRELIPLADGDVFDYATYQLAQPELPLALGDAGYAAARVEGVILADRDRAKVVIRLTVELGPRVKFGKVTVTGVPRGLGDAVHNRIRIREGQLYSTRALEDTRAQLYEMGRFSIVRVELDRAPDGDVADVRVAVAEAKRHDLRIGGGVGLDPASVEIRGRSLHSVAAWPWPRTTSRVEARPAVAIKREDGSLSPRVDASAAIDRLDFIRPRHTGAAEVSYAYLAVEAYTSYGPRLRLSARTPVFRKIFQVSAGWQLAQVSYRELSPALDPMLVEHLGLDGSDRIGSFDQSLIVDLRDDKLRTRQGAYLDLRTEEGTLAAGGDATFLRVMPDLRGYLSAGPVTFAARVRAGAVVGDVPATRRFFGGGAGGYRGLPGRQLSPFAMTASGQGVPYGGTAMLDLSTEARVPLTTWRALKFGLATFIDGGDVTEGWGAIDAGDLHWAAGAGLRIDTIVGIIRADLAYRLTRSGSGEPRPGDDFAYHLGIGEAF